MLGPGVISGASDDDPAGIGTYAQTGAQFGFTQLWTALFTFPLMAAIQEICARIALQTGQGLAGTIRRHYPKPVLYTCIALLLIANAVNLGADLGAMAASAGLFIPLPFPIWLIGITLFSGVLVTLLGYHRYSTYLRYLTLSLFAYVLSVFLIPLDWGLVLRKTLVPSLQLNQEYLLNLVALLGTTISPYLFFWQASQEIEEKIDNDKRSSRRKGASRFEIRSMRTDVISGMLFSNAVMWFIIVASASTLFSDGSVKIDSATKAAEALRPIAGEFAYVLFALGIIGTGLLAVPVLAGSCAYAIAETFKFRSGLYRRLRDAPGFYGVIFISMGIGFVINLFNINPVLALYYSAVLNGVIAPPLLVIIMLIGSNPGIMKDKVNGRISKILGWATAILMTLSAAALLLSFLSDSWLLLKD